MQDGLIQDDRRCKLPRGTLGCTAEKTWDCLDAAKLAAVERLWNKPILSNGRRLPAEGHGYEDEMPAQFFYAGASPAALLRLLMFSSKVEAGNNFELSAPAPGLPLTQVLPWLFVGAPSSVEELTESYSRGVLLPGRSVDVHTFDVAGDGPQLAREIRAIVDVTDQPDLNVFLKRGSKLLLWHGLADTTLPPGGTIEYFDLARERWLAEGLSADAFDRAVRLYTAPAIGHCTGGSGPNEADLLGALDAWVTAGNTPEAITTVRRADDGTIARSRILCPMPQEPRYVGQGSIDDARSFTCAIPPDRVGTTGFRSSPPLGG